MNELVERIINFPGIKIIVMRGDRCNEVFRFKIILSAVLIQPFYKKIKFITFPAEADIIADGAHFL
jgi:hypothetical protein